MEYKKWEYNYMKHNVDSTNKRQGLAILEQLIEYTQHSNNISNDELRDDIFNIYIAVILPLYDTSRNIIIIRVKNHRIFCYVS